LFKRHAVEKIGISEGAYFSIRFQALRFHAKISARVVLFLCRIVISAIFANSQGSRFFKNFCTIGFFFCTNSCGKAFMFACLLNIVTIFSFLAIICFL
jgi:hypothetical protein